MAGASKPGTDVGGSWPKSWQVALAIGAPLAIGAAVGAYFYHRRSSDKISGETAGKTGSDLTGDDPAPLTDERVCDFYL